MKRIILILAVMLAAQKLPAQWRTEASPAPLILYTNGLGRISPFSSGQLLEVGYRYTLSASPKGNYAFANWKRVTVYRAVSTTHFPSGPWLITTNTTVFPHGEPIYEARLDFTMPAASMMVETNDSSIISTTKIEGWQANFVRASR